jgi:hypothetical protein
MTFIKELLADKDREIQALRRRLDIMNSNSPSFVRNDGGTMIIEDYM